MATKKLATSAKLISPAISINALAATAKFFRERVITVFVEIAIRFLENQISFKHRGKHY